MLAWPFEWVSCKTDLEMGGKYWTLKDNSNIQEVLRDCRLLALLSE